MKSFDYRPYILQILLGVAGYFLLRNVGEDHAAALAAEVASKTEVKSDIRDLKVEVGALRSETNRVFLEFKEFAAEKNLRDKHADEVLREMKDFLRAQNTRRGRFAYLPRGVPAATDRYRPPMDTVKIPFLSKRF